MANDGAEYDTVLIWEYRNYEMSKATAANGNITLFLEDVGSLKINAVDGFIEAFDKNMSSLSVYKQNSSGERVVNASSLPKDSVVSIYAPLGGYENNAGIIRPKDDINYIRLVFSTDTVSGKVTSRDPSENVISIDGEEYTVSKSNMLGSDWNEISSYEQDFSLDFKGHIVGVGEKKKTSWKYGYLIRPYWNYDDDGELPTSFKLLTAAGKVEKIAVNAEMKLNGKKNKYDDTIISKLRVSAAMINPDFNFSQLIKYITNEEGEITDVQTVTKPLGYDASKYTESQLSRYCEPTMFRIWDDSSSRLTYSNNDSLSAYFKPKSMFRVPLEEDSGDEKYSVRGMTSSGSDIKLEVYDVDKLTPNVAIYYSDTTAEKWLSNGKNGSATIWPSLFSKATIGLDNDGEAVCKIEVAGPTGMMEYQSNDPNIAKNLKKGQMIYMRVLNDKITEIVPLRYKGQPIGPENLPPVDYFGDIRGSLSGFSIEQKIYAAEPYELGSAAADFVLQAGPITNGLKREHQFTGSIMNDFWMMGGLMVYDEEEDIVRTGTRDDLRTVVDYGRARASVVIGYMHNGAARAYYVYNMQ